MNAGQWRFRFVIKDGQETIEFTVAPDQTIEDALQSTVENAHIKKDYCNCYDMCYCENGHYVAMHRFEYANPEKPWEGKMENYYVPLEEWVEVQKTTGKGKNKKVEKFHAWEPYYNR